MRTGLIMLLPLLLAVPSLGQDIGELSIGDSVLVEDALLQPKPKYTTNYLTHFGEPTPAEIIKLEHGDGYVQVKVEGKEGWVKKGTLSPIGPYRRLQKRKRQLRQKGYTILLARQTFRKNSADGISVGLEPVNISQSKTIKYLRITWKLFNSVGDPTAGKNTGSATAQTQLVGPVEPKETGYTVFENVWYSSVGTCAEIWKIEVEHVDGSSFTYINDLEDIARDAEGVRVKGDCSYEAQQARRQ